MLSQAVLLEKKAMCMCVCVGGGGLVVSISGDLSTSLFCYLVPDAASEYYLPLATTLLYSTSTVPLIPSLRVPPISTVQVPVVVLLLGRVPPKGLIFLYQADKTAIN